MELLAIGQLYSTFESSLFHDEVWWNRPQLDGPYGFHNHPDTYRDPDAEFWRIVIFPTNEALLVKKMDLQKRGDGHYPLNTISFIKIKYMSEDGVWMDYLNGD